MSEDVLLVLREKHLFVMLSLCDFCNPLIPSVGVEFNFNPYAIINFQNQILAQYQITTVSCSH